MTLGTMGGEDPPGYALAVSLLLALVTRLWRTVAELAAIGLAWVLGPTSGAHNGPAGEKR